MLAINPGAKSVAIKSSGDIMNLCETVHIHLYGIIPDLLRSVIYERF